MDEQTFHALLAKGAQHKASDVLLKVGQPPAFRVGGDLHYMNADKLKPAQTQRLAESCSPSRAFLVRSPTCANTTAPTRCRAWAAIA